MSIDPDDFMQIIPADGWWAVYKIDGGMRTKSKIAAIALKRNGNVSFLDADYSGYIDDASIVSNLEGIYYQGDKHLEGL